MQKANNNKNDTRFNEVDHLRLRFWLSQFVLLVALVGIITEDISLSPILITLTGFISVSLIHPPLAGFVPRKWMRLISVLLIIIVLIDIWYHWPMILNPVLRAGYLILWTRTIFYRTARESLQLLFLALFLIVLTGVMSLSISYAIQLIIFTPSAMVLLILNSTKDPASRDCLEHNDWKGVNLFTFSRKLIKILNVRLVLLLFMSMAFTLVSVAAIFVILPRFHFRPLLPSLTVPGIARSGFTEQFSLGSVNQILQDNRVAFRVQLPENGVPPEAPYWRMLALDKYDNGAFSRSENNSGNLRKLTQFTAHYAVANYLLPNLQHDHQGDWVFFMEGSVSRYLPCPGSFRSIQFQAINSLQIDPQFSTFNLSQTSSQITIFRLNDVAPDLSFRRSALDKSLNNPAVIHQNSGSGDYPFTTLETNLSNDDVIYLNQALGLPNHAHISEYRIAELQTIIASITGFLQQNHNYSLTPTISGTSGTQADPIVNWMRSSGDGHCEYFAAAAVLLFRTHHIPARIVSGFAGGDWDEDSRMFTVRNSHAHAWCEIYHPAVGWIRVDPTPPNREWMGSSISNGLGIFGQSDWFEWIEDLKIQYYRTVIGFDDNDQFSFLTRLGNKLSSISWRFPQIGSIFNSSDNDKTAVNVKHQQESKLHHPKREAIFQILLILGVFFASFVSFYFAIRIQRNVRRKDELHEKRIRSRAAKILERYTVIDKDDLSVLLRLRYGPVSSWIAPIDSIKRIKTALRGSK